MARLIKLVEYNWGLEYGVDLYGAMVFLLRGESPQTIREVFDFGLFEGERKVMLTMITVIIYMIKLSYYL